MVVYTRSVVLGARLIGEGGEAFTSRRTVKATQGGPLISVSRASLLAVRDGHEPLHRAREYRFTGAGQAGVIEKAGADGPKYRGVSVRCASLAMARGVPISEAESYPQNARKDLGSRPRP